MLDLAVKLSAGEFLAVSRCHVCLKHCILMDAMAASSSEHEQP